MTDRLTTPPTAARLVVALLLLGAVFAMHGLSCTGSADAAHSAPPVTIAGPSGHTRTATTVMTDMLADPVPQHPAARPAAVDHVGSCSAVFGLRDATLLPPTGRDSAPHGSAAHLWAVCLAVLAAGLASMLAALAPQLIKLVTRALSRALARARGSLPLPPDLHALCLLRT